MILSDYSIMERVALEDGDAKKIVIEPFNEANVQSASLDIVLSNSFTQIVKEPIRDKDKKKVNVKNLKNGVDYKTIITDSYILYPKKFVLCSSLEYFALPNDISASVEGRSSVGRLGVFVQNAGWIDPGFEGQITLELYNAGSAAVELTAGMRIAQIVFAETSTPVQKPYRGKYVGQRGATGSRIQEDKEWRELGNS